MKKESVAAKTFTKHKAVVFTMSVFFLGLALLIRGKGTEEKSESERRKLAQFPQVSWETVASGRFMEDFEEYAMDQFPFREMFRSWKAFFAFDVFGQKDNHGIYVADGYAVKMEYPLAEKSVERAMERFRYIYEKYMRDTDVKLYCSVIPDKNYFLADKYGYLSLDYDTFFKMIQSETNYMEYIDITNLLEIEDYYKTDIHWRQEKLGKVVDVLAERMGISLSGRYQVNVLDKPFYGVYAGQSALPLAGEEIKYLSNEIVSRCKVYDYENNKSTEVYDMEKAYGSDPYEMFLSGSLSLMEIENPQAKTDKELILFRDSFGSSLAPLLAEGYAKITLVDIRYIHPDMLGKYIEFGKQDVLFLYSVPVLNHGEALK